MKLRKYYSRTENSEAQKMDESVCIYPQGISWVDKMSASWEVVDIPGLIISCEPPANQRLPQRMMWQSWTSTPTKQSAAWKVAKLLGGQRFATRREIMQAIQAAYEAVYRSENE